MFGGKIDSEKSQRVPLLVFSPLWDFSSKKISPKGHTFIFLMCRDRMDVKKSKSVPLFSAPIRSIFWVFQVL